MINSEKIHGYIWMDGFDGGDRSETFATKAEAIESAERHTASIRLTEKELTKLEALYTAYVGIYAIDDDNNIIEDIDSIEINNNTAMIYHD